MNKNQIQETFIPGSEWLYYKVYCGTKTAEDILLDIVKPLTKEFLKKNIIDKWFFIRYSDPEHHLRIRFHITEQKNIETVIIKLKEQLFPLVKNNLIWDLQLATYQRELKRYGFNTIELAESYFFYDTKKIIKILETSRNNDKKRFRLIIKNIVIILNLFDLKQDEKITFLDKMQLKFKNEFIIDNVSKKNLGKEYRKFRKKINLPKFLEKELDKKELKTQRLIVLNLINACGKKENNIVFEDILASLIHMSINRSFKSNQRLQEMIIYDYLYKLFKEQQYAKN